MDKESQSLDTVEPMYELTGFQRDVLYVTMELGEPIGVEICRRLQNYYGEEICPRLYKNLNDLREMGFLEEVDGEYKNTRRNVVSDKGRVALDRDLAWRKERMKSESQQSQND